MSPEAQKALINAGRLIRMQIADGNEALRLARAEAGRQDQRLGVLQDRFDEIKAALVAEGLELPPVTSTRAA